MPRRDDIKTIAIIGAGPIVIGQACEFDYSGAQACKALREEGYRVVLINSNPATIMTDPNMADATYIEPITPEIVTMVLEKEKVDALLPTMGGQTALNAAMTLANDGTLDRLGIQMIGADKAAIEMAEDRQLFRDAMTRIGLESPKSHVVNSLDEAQAKLDDIGLPAIIRPSFTLGGAGGGIAYNLEEFLAIVKSGLEASPIREVLVEESVLGWKEYEMEVVRDRNDNAIIICSIENIDAMGVHTGDSITVAPAQTLTDKEYQIMRDASIAVLREIGVETGGSNVQFAVNPENGRMVVIEMNPRVSRSSALASKATGFPIAKIAAKLAVGYTLDELQNDITRVTPASFEPSIDYVVTKIPRFAFEKFKGSPDTLSTSMKSVGEVMAIGRNFEESLQKALISMEIGIDGLDEVLIDGEISPHPDVIYKALSQQRPERILKIAQAFRHGMDVETAYQACRYDRWFLRRIEDLVKIENLIKQHGLPKTADGMGALKNKGFSDARLAKLAQISVTDVQEWREKWNVVPCFKAVDSCAAEFKSDTAYLYGTYELAQENQPLAHDNLPSGRQKVIILGGGPNRIGQGIEFDYCCVHACFAMKELGIESIMINCNPETVSTDYDTADRLYFEPLTFEHVMNIIRFEQSKGELLGVIVQLGGQTPLKLAQELKDAGVKILGTDPDSIDLAEDRERFQHLIEKLGILQPLNGIAKNKEQALEIANRIGFPLVIRPSYVLGGRAMEIVQDINHLTRYIDEAVQVSGKNPVLLDTYLQNAIELDVDALCDGTDVFVAGIMEHIEEAGVHSGDSACSLPPFSLDNEMIQKVTEQTERLAKALNVVGLMNVQFAIMRNKDGVKELYILEVNPRASRTVPFVAKATGTELAKIASALMAGKKLTDYQDRLFPMPTNRMAVKETVIPFVRFPNTDTILGPEMKSTGEVMGMDVDFARAFSKSQLAVGMTLPRSGTAFLSVKDQDKPTALEIAKMLYRQGFDLIATHGTARYLMAAGLSVRVINKVMQGQPHVVDALINGEIDFIINTTKGPREMVDSFSLRRKALTSNIPYYTTIAAAEAAVRAITSKEAVALDVKPLQAYLASR